jgi:hypothetical protein
MSVKCRHDLGSCDKDVEHEGPHGYQAKDDLFNEALDLVFTAYHHVTTRAWHDKARSLLTRTKRAP